MIFATDMDGLLQNDKKSITIAKVFQKFLNVSGRRPSKIWVDQDKEPFNRSMK